MKLFGVGIMALVLAATPAWAGVKDGVDAREVANYAKAVAEWRGPAAAGDADAQFNLAQSYKLGRGVPLDVKLAQDWYLKAALQNHEQAQADLGLLLFQNDDRKAAMPWIEKAAERGEPRCQYVLGTALFNGDVMAKNWPRAYAMMTRAAASGLPPAATSLGQMDRFIPTAERQQGIILARELDKPMPAPAPATPRAPKPLPPVRTVALPASISAPLPKSEPVETAKVAMADGWRVQLGAFGTPQAARAAWAGFNSRSAALKTFQPILIDAGTVTRLQAGPLASRAAANRLCGAVKTGGASCFIVAR